MEIHAIPAPTEESEARKEELLKLKQTRPLTDEERNELFNLEVRVLWNCEC